MLQEMHNLHQLHYLCIHHGMTIVHIASYNYLFQMDVLQMVGIYSILHLVQEENVDQNNTLNQLMFVLRHKHNLFVNSSTPDQYK